jgi:hypothetical protein
MSTTVATSPSRALVVWQPRRSLLGTLKRIPPVVIVAAAALATYAALPLIVSPSNGNTAQVVEKAVVTPLKLPEQNALSVAPASPPKAVVADYTPPPPPVAAPAPQMPVVGVVPSLVTAVRPNSALVAPHEVARAVREVEPMQRAMRSFAPMMRNGFPFRALAGGFPRGGFGLARGFGGIRLFRR